MQEIRQTHAFTEWLADLKDSQARGRIAARVQRLKFGHLGDVKPVGFGVSELRIDTGPGYRIYLMRDDETIILLLCGGDKGSQKRDILRARALAAEVKNENRNHNL